MIEIHHDRNMVAYELDDAATLRGRDAPGLYRYWQDKRGDRAYPTWQEIALVDLWREASTLAVLNVIDGGEDFHARYWGTRLAEAIGTDVSGRNMTQIAGIDPDPAFVNFRWVVDNGRPLLSYRRYAFVDRREHVCFEAVHLPLGPAGGPVTHIISAHDFDCDLTDLLGD